MEELIPPEKPYQLCTRCVMDTSAPDISFDEEGVCSFCTEFLQNFGHIVRKTASEKEKERKAFISAVKRAGRRKRYDCIVGVSGGVDSSWVLAKTVKLGLRPLAVHMDNGWDSELAQSNIANLVRILDVDLYTHVIDWDEYRNLMQAFFDAGVIDVELLYDNAMLAVNYRMAARYGVKYILSGSNKVTEGMRMPKGWNWFKYDKKNIKAIGKKFGNTRLKTFPAFGTLDFIWSAFIQRIKWTCLLDMMTYNKFEAMQTLQKDFGYKPYAYKHYESVFTRFYQGYLLPEKFQVDKRRLHLGALVMSGQMTRADALRDLAKAPYPSDQDLSYDIQYFLKKMGWTAAQLKDYIRRSEISHACFATEYPLAKFLKRIHTFFAG